MKEALPVVWDPQTGAACALLLVKDVTGSCRDIKDGAQCVLLYAWSSAGNVVQATVMEGEFAGKKRGLTLLLAQMVEAEPSDAAARFAASLGVTEAELRTVVVQSAKCLL